MAADMALPASDNPVSKSALRRLHHDILHLQRSPNPQIEVRPHAEKLLEWHFVLHSLPEDTPYSGGCYHGKIQFPAKYPHEPPAILMITPSERLEVGMRLCLSMTDFHPESWNPAWSVETILVGLLSVFIADAEKGHGFVSQSAESRRKLAEQSWAFNAKDVEFTTLFPDFVQPASRAATSSAAAAAGPAGDHAGEVVVAGKVDSDSGEGDAAGGGQRHAAAGEAVGGSEEGLQHAGAGWRWHETAAGARLATADPAAAPAGKAPPGEAASAASVGQGPAPAAWRGEGESEAGRAAGAAAPAGEEEEPEECWICRDTETGEPLIHPCACRGSMSGVHASCVEEWIAHHRRNATNLDPPRCSVCHQPYHGQEQRPGVGTFLRHTCVSAALRLARLTAVVALSEAYATAATPQSKWPLWLQIPTVLVFAVAVLHKAVVLTVSFPLHADPPRQRLLRRFYVGDPAKLTNHCLDVYFGLASLAYCAAAGLPVQFVLPVLLVVLIPVAKHLPAWRPSLQCLRVVCWVFGMIVVSPFVVLWMMVCVVYRYPRQTFHPLGPTGHIAVAIAAISLALACASNAPLVVLLAIHSVLLVAGLIEVLYVRRLQWLSCNVWVIAVQLTLMAWTFCVSMRFDKGFGAPDSIEGVLDAAATIWLCLVVALAASIHRESLRDLYRTWQNQHGTFTLQVPLADAGGAANDGAANIGAV